MRYVSSLKSHEPSLNIVIVSIGNIGIVDFLNNIGIGSPFFFNQQIQYINIVVYQFGFINFFEYEFNKDGLYHAEDERIILNVLLRVFKNSIKIRGKISKKNLKDLCALNGWVQCKTGFGSIIF